MVACHLTRILQSGGYPQFRQDVALEQKPDANYPQNYQYLFQWLSPQFKFANPMLSSLARRVAALALLWKVI